MITPAYSPTATERVLPRLALDFTTASLDARVTVTRAANTATRVDSSGYVTLINANLPRFDYDPVTLVCKGLLIEESRQNLTKYSSDFTQSSWWSKDAACTITQNATLAPDGTNTAQAIAPGSNGNTKGISQGLALFQNGRTFSFFVKAGEITVVTGQNGAGQTWTFDASAGTFSGVNAAYSNATAVNMGNSWWRCSLTCSAMAGTDFFIGASANANGTNKFYLWGFQIEVGAFATSYIPTGASSGVTRNADQVTMTGTNFSSWYNASEGSMVALYDTVMPSGSGYAYGISNGSTTQFIGGNISTGNAGVRVDNSGTQANLQVLAYAVNTPIKTCLGYKANSFVGAGNGLAPLTDDAGTIPTVDRMHIGSVNAVIPLNGHVAKLFYYSQRVTNAEAQAFSK